MAWFRTLIASILIDLVEAALALLHTQGLWLVHEGKAV